MNRGCFVTGTDTGVGKTAITAALAYYLCEHGISVGVMKPIETGIGPDEESRSDAALLRAAAGAMDALDLISPYRFPDPVAPLAAARRTGKTIELDRIINAFGRLASASRPIFVEGVGGLLAPLSESFETADLIRSLQLPAIVVGRAGLGGINHTMLTLEALARRNIPVLAVVLNSPCFDGRQSSADGVAQQVRTTVELVQELADLPVCGPIAHVSRLAQHWTDGVSELSRDPAIKELASLVMHNAR